MEKVNIQFGGMSNIPDVSSSRDGNMAVLLNAEVKNGEIVPRKKPEETPGVVIKKAIFHNNSKMLIELTNSGLFADNFLLDKSEDVNNFEVMGNIVVGWNDSNPKYWIYKDGTFSVMSHTVLIPDLTVNIEKKKVLRRSTKTSSNPDDSTYFWKLQKGTVDQALCSVYEDCGFVDRVWFRVVVTLFDGTTYAGDVLEVSCYENNLNVGDFNVKDPTIGCQVLNYSDATDEVIVQLNYIKTELSLLLKAQDNELLSLIASYDIYSTGSIHSFRSDWLSDNEVENPISGVEIYRHRDAFELKQAIADADFYKVASFNTSGTQTWALENTSPGSLMSQDRLEDTVVEQVIVNKADVYNAKLHAYDYKSVLFEGYAPVRTTKKQKKQTYNIYVYIKTDDGIKVVERKYECDQELQGTFFYPDSRAFKAVIQNDEKQAVLNLEPHTSRNMAYYIRTTGKENVSWKEKIPYNDSNAPDETITITNVALGLINKLEFDDSKSAIKKSNEVFCKNILKVSALDNPFYFPAAQTYKFDGDIVAVESNAEAVSPGQFGVYPLFVFTTRGIFALQVDTSGKGAYSTQASVSREICNGSVCAFPGGFAFTTDRGVMAISGGQVTELSGALNGFPDEITNVSNVMKDIFKKAGYTSLLDEFPPDTIRSYTKGAKLAYDYVRNELIVSNKAYSYSYVYGISDGCWSITDIVFDSVAERFPALRTYNSDKNVQYDFVDNRNGSFLAITRPMKVETLNFKRIRQAALRCLFTGTLNFYVLGSNDGVNFVCITGKEYPSLIEDEPTNKLRRDLVTSMARSKQYKYIAIAVSGNMTGRVSFAELLVEGGFANNQLR